MPDTAIRPQGSQDAETLVSRTGVRLSRPATFRFTLDLNHEQDRQCFVHAGAARLAFNHHIGRVRANLEQRTAERSYGIPEEQLTPSLSWSKVSFINEMNAWKDGRAPDAPVTVDETTGLPVRGLAWRGEVSAYVFECASAHAAQALSNWQRSRAGESAVKAIGFPRFKSKHESRPAFRLRSKYKEGGQPSPVRPTGAKTIRFPKLGELRVRESTRKLRRMMTKGRFHVYAAAFRYERGRWVVAVTGVASEFHHQRRGPEAPRVVFNPETKRRDPVPRHRSRAGVDLGVKTLAVIADENGSLLEAHQGVKALQHAQARLRMANKTYSRTKTGSIGRIKAGRRLGKMHARVVAVRKALLHEVTAALAKGYTHLTVEDLNAAGMVKNRKLARHVSDAAFGEFRRQLEYKTEWYGTELVVADRWFPSSKTCSGCGNVQAELKLSDRVYLCIECGLVIDRDLNAAINLARYTAGENPTDSPPRPVAA